MGNRTEGVHSNLRLSVTYSDKLVCPSAALNTALLRSVHPSTSLNSILRKGYPYLPTVLLPGTQKSLSQVSLALVSKAASLQSQTPAIQLGTV